MFKSALPTENYEPVTTNSEMLSGFFVTTARISHLSMRAACSFDLTLLDVMILTRLIFDDDYKL
jgi:hypothetical protein